MSQTSFLPGVIAAALAGAVFASSSVSAFAAPEKSSTGELIVLGKTAVTVNGEAADTGRTFFSSDTITTPADASAIVGLGQQGQVELAPGSTLSLQFDENNISAALQKGRVRISGANGVAALVTTETGKVIADPNQVKAFAVSFDGSKTEASSEAGNVTLNENGEAAKLSVEQKADGGYNSFTALTLVRTVIFGIAAKTIAYIAARNNNEFALNSSSSVVGSTR